MSDDILDSVEGPRTLRIFRNLLILAVLLFVLGAFLSEFYGFTLLERFAGVFVDDPMLLLRLASVIAFFVLLFIAGRFVLQHVE